jgi:hypothetical protein
MELPEEIKNLYRHWKFHTEKSKKEGYLPLPEEVLWFINERISIWEQKISGALPPYTQDLVLSKYRFCNIFRELDRQTIEIHTLLNPIRENFSLWLLNMFYARMVARPETLYSTGLLSFDKKENQKVFKKLSNHPRPRFGTPYVFPISVIQKSKTPTREAFISSYLPTVMDKVAKEIQQWEQMSVYDGVQKIIPIFGYNLYFLWTEVLIDVAYQFPDRLDLFKRFPIGPGSLPTIKKLAPDSDPSLYVAMLADYAITTDLTYNTEPLRLSAENWEGVGCEYRKYTNLKVGKGRKRVYKKYVVNKLKS